MYLPTKKSPPKSKAKSKGKKTKKGKKSKDAVEVKEQEEAPAIIEECFPSRPESEYPPGYPYHLTSEANKLLSNQDINVSNCKPFSYLVI